jgi:6-phosphogluconolactonase
MCAGGPQYLSFGPFEFDRQRRELCKHQVRIRLQRQPTELLQTLLASPGEVVKREELRRRLWPDGLHVDFDRNLNRCVNKLRAALCDSADQPRYIETIPGEGYRFIAPVEILSCQAPAIIASQNVEPVTITVQSESIAGGKEREEPLEQFKDSRKLGWLFAFASVILLAALVPLLHTKANRVPPLLHAVHPKNVYTRRFVYVIDYSGNTISGHIVNSSTGLLEPLATLVTRSGEHPYKGAISPDEQFLYVANRGLADGACGKGCSISGFAIDHVNGGLRELDGSPFAAGSGPVALAMHPSGKFLYVANVISNDVYVYVRTEDGRLSRSGTPIPVGTHPFYVTITPSGRFLYVSNQDDATVSGFAIDDGGQLHDILGSPFKTGLRPRFIVVDPPGHFVYVVNHGVNPYTDRNAASSGTFGYVHGSGCTISVFAIEPDTGALTQISGSPFDSGGINPISAAMDPAGKYLFVGNISSNNVSVFQINHESGIIRPVPGSPFQAGNGPVSIAFDSGGFLYVANAFSRNVSEFEFDPTDGRLLRLGDLPTKDLSPADIVME